MKTRRNCDGATYSTNGPVCPHCEREFTPDEAFYFDESLNKLHCDECDKDFQVEVCNETSWTCREMPAPPRIDRNTAKGETA
jgi:hypothetical protein